MGFDSLFLESPFFEEVLVGFGGLVLGGALDAFGPSVGSGPLLGLLPLLSGFLLEGALGFSVGLG